MDFIEFLITMLVFLAFFSSLVGLLIMIPFIATLFLNLGGMPLCYALLIVWQIVAWWLAYRAARRRVYQRERFEPAFWGAIKDGRALFAFVPLIGRFIAPKR